MPHPQQLESSLQQPLLCEDDISISRDTLEVLAATTPTQSDRARSNKRTSQVVFGQQVLAPNANAAPRSPNDDSSTSLQMKKRNIQLTLWYASIAFAGRSIWNQSVLAAFVYLLQDQDTRKVGFLTGAMGVAQLLASFPAGYLADAYQRDTILKMASVVGLLAIAATIAACWCFTNYESLVVALSLWGVYYGVANTTIMALFADSVPEKQRCLYFTQRSIRVMSGNLMGPICALTMFHLMGNEWTLRDCAMVMTLGQVICAPAVVLLCFFRDGERRDDDDLSIDQEVDPETAEVDTASLTTDDDSVIENGGDPLCQDLLDRTVMTGASDEDDESMVGHERRSQNLPFQCIMKNHPRTIPILVAFSDVLSGLGAGMSVRYFPLFFMDQLKFSPIEVQIVYICCTVMQVMLANLSQKLADGFFGRCWTTVFFKWAGIVFMISMILSHHSGLAPRWVIGLLFVLRTGFMNSCGALTRSLLMDNVPSNERGKWSAIESVNMFSWSGSAALGGVLVGWFGMLPLFGLTSGIQFVSTCVVLSLVQIDKIPLTLRRSRYNRLSDEQPPQGDY